MGIDLKDIKLGDRYLCRFLFDGAIGKDYLVVEFSPVNLQDKRYVRLRYENENSGIPMSKWATYDMLIGSIVEKLEGENNDVNDTYLEWSPIEAEGLKSEIGKEKVDYLQEFVKLQTEYLKMLIEEKKDTNNRKG